jgi:hypothetical protein
MMNYHDPDAFRVKCSAIREREEFKAASPIQRTEFMLAQHLKERLVCTEQPINFCCNAKTGEPAYILSQKFVDKNELVNELPLQKT